MKLETFRFRSFCSGEDYKSQKMFIYDAVLINAAYVITTGFIMSGYLLLLGASDFLAALINNSASFSAILCVFSFVIFEKLAYRKTMLISLNIISRTLLMLILVIPFIFDSDRTIFLFIAMTVITSDIVFSIYRVGWLVWIMDIAPVRNRTNYVYMRMFYLRCAFSIVTLASGFILDIFDKGYTGFLILFLFSYVLSILDVIVLKGIREKPFSVDVKSKSLESFLTPLKVKAYRDYLVFIFLFYFSFFISSAFMPVYMIKYLEFDYKFILSMNVLSLLAMIFSNLIWMRIENKKGGNYVLIVSSLMQATGVFMTAFLTNSTFYILYFSSVITGMGAGGFNTTSFTYRYELMPEVGRTIYESWFYLVFGVATLMAPFAANLIIRFLPEFTTVVFQYSKLQLLFMISALLLCLTVLFTSVKKHKDKTKNVPA